MKTVGITGPSGSGKSLLCETLRQRDIPCIDADRVYHSLLIPPSSCLDALRANFGDGVFCADGSLDRAALGAIVFADGEKLKLLNSTVLGFVLVRIRELIADYVSQGYSVVAVDAPTLIESGFNKECDIVVSVVACEQVRIERIMARDSITLERATQRTRAQKSEDFYSAHSDYMIENNGSSTELTQKIEKLFADGVFDSTEGDDEKN